MRQLTIQIVEDEIISAMALRSQLIRGGHKVLPLSVDGIQALDIFKSGAPDIILCDIRLAGEMDGLKVAEKLRQQTGTPIIFMTGYDTAEIKAQTAKVTNSAYAIKPVTMRDLKDLIEHLIKDTDS